MDLEKSKQHLARERSWLTSKARMEAEKRFRKYEYTWHIVLCVVSIILIAVSVVEPEFPSYFSDKAYNVIASVIILSVTLIVFGFRFGERAAEYRESYLKIQSIQNAGLDDDDFAKEYQRILDAYPNHGDHDYNSFIIKNLLLYNRKTKDSRDNEINIKSFLVLQWSISCASFWIAPFLIILIMAIPFFI